jgi:hypothetical protein
MLSKYRTTEELYQVSTTPDFVQTWEKFKATVKNLQDALTGIRRIERLAYPSMNFRKGELLRHPDLEKVENLDRLAQRILWLLKYAEREPLQ